MINEFLTQHTLRELEHKHPDRDIFDELVGSHLVQIYLHADHKLNYRFSALDRTRTNRRAN